MTVLPVAGQPDIPAHLQEAIQAELAEDEQLFWRSQPDPRRAAALASKVRLAGLLVLVAGLAWVALIGGGFVKSLPRLMGPLAVPGLAMGLFLVVLPRLSAAKSRQMVYAVTDRRAIVMEVGKATKIFSFGPEKLREIVRTERPNGLGDLVFRGPNGGFAQRGPSICSGFYGIAHARDVQRMLDILAQTAPAPDLADGSHVPRMALRGSSATFRTAHVVEAGPDRLVLTASRSAKAFYFVVAAMGGGLGAVLVPGLLKGGGVGASVGLLLVPTVCGLFLLLGLLGLTGRLGNAPVVFDRSAGRLWTRRGKFGSRARSEGIPLNEVEALQVCSYCASGEDSSYTAYELNLVLRDAEGQLDRKTLACHARRTALYDDARRLAEHLDVPLLDHAAAG